MSARTRTEITNVVGLIQYFSIVLDNHQRVAQVAKFVQRVQQALIIAGMQSNSWFVQHIKHATQAAAQLARQTDPLEFPSRQSCGSTSQCEVFQTHIAKETQPALNFAYDLTGYFSFPGIESPMCQFSL